MEKWVPSIEQIWPLYVEEVSTNPEFLINPHSKCMGYKCLYCGETIPVEAKGKMQQHIEAHYHRREVPACNFACNIPEWMEV